MPDEKVALDGRFLARQRERLEALRNQLLAAMGETEIQERDLQDRNVDETGDLADRSSPVIQSEIDNARHAVNERRLAAVERALQKIEEGTYGISDASGEPIPRERLEIQPEAIYTIEEERQREAAGPAARS